MILKEKFVLAFFGHLEPCWPAVHTFAIFFVVHKDVSSFETGQAHHVKMFCVAAFGQIKKMCTYSFYIAIMVLFAFFNQHKVYSFQVCLFLAYSVHNNAIVFPAKNIYCKFSVLRLKLVMQSVLPVLGNRCLCN